MAFQLKNHETRYIKNNMDWTEKPLIEQIDHVWFDHGNLFSSRIREEMNGDQQAMELVDEFEEAWRNLHEYVLENATHENRQQIKERRVKEKIKPLIHKKLQEIKERR